ncbi:hypothetical protein D3C71_1825910 [compost metagenome]
MDLDGGLFQQGLRGLVATGFIDTVFVVPVDGLDLMLAAYCEQRVWRFVPSIEGTDQQRDVELIQ